MCVIEMLPFKTHPETRHLARRGFHLACFREERAVDSGFPTWCLRTFPEDFLVSPFHKALAASSRGKRDFLQRKEGYFEQTKEQARSPLPARVGFTFGCGSKIGSRKGPW